MYIYIYVDYKPLAKWDAHPSIQHHLSPSHSFASPMLCDRLSPWPQFFLFQSLEFFRRNPQAIGKSLYNWAN